ncbi:PREDICTED: uncharacterized protein K02A2.6-like [Vollenhovia emeryi]|uniref:uncharacterized protein K02A2.6-like n=1 Tax=Vollenhovia emeryi TaxID=411798 RepID=UPI0005F3DC75|nr:PREDICTED: uncharacterized protein K02A2.6-like [Vollenhovia emeryi]
MLGRFNGRLKLHGRQSTGTIYVSARNLNLLGTDWMEALGLWDVPISAVCSKVATASTPLEEEVKSKFPSLFDSSLGLCNKMKASLTLKVGAQPVFRKKRPVPFAAAAQIESELKRLQLLGVIEPVTTSEYAAPLVAVKKRDGRVRICADYSTGLNDALESNQYPLPVHEEIFANIAPFKLFSKVDLSDAFLQIELDDNAKKMMTINTHLGLFQVNRLQPGVKTAPGIFQKLIDEMLKGAKGAFAFIDDIIVGGTDSADHRRNLMEVLKRLQDYGFHLRIDKCLFAQKKLEFLGLIISEDGLKPSTEKIELLRNIPSPINVQQLQSFLGAVTWYGKFLPSVKDLRGPLDELLCKEVKFEWKMVHQKAFEKLKEALSSDLALTYYDPKKKIIVAADASSYGMGAVIMHELNDGTLKPIMHAARSFNSTEKNYPQVQREALALTFAVSKFHRYIYGRAFELHTDHKPLLAIFGSKKGIPVHTASRLQRYALILLAYDFTIKYINTKSFAYADFVSRLIANHCKVKEDVVIGSIGNVKINAQSHLSDRSNEKKPKDDYEDTICFAIDTAHTLPVTFQILKEETGNCATLKIVAQYIEQGWPETIKKFTNPEAAKFFTSKDSLTVIDGCIFFGDRIVVPTRLRKQILCELHQGHPGTARMRLLAKSKVFWPKLDVDIQELVRRCKNCATNDKTPTKCTLQSWPIPQGPWSRVHVDYAGPINDFMYLVVVDAFSNWPEVFKMTTTTSAKTIDRLEEAIARHGLMDTLVSDNGPQAN